MMMSWKSVYNFLKGCSCILPWLPIYLINSAKSNAWFWVMSLMEHVVLTISPASSWVVISLFIMGILVLWRYRIWSYRMLYMYSLKSNLILTFSLRVLCIVSNQTKSLYWWVLYNLINPCCWPKRCLRSSEDLPRLCCLSASRGRREKF